MYACVLMPWCHSDQDTERVASEFTDGDSNPFSRFGSLVLGARLPAFVRA